MTREQFGQRIALAILRAEGMRVNQWDLAERVGAHLAKLEDVLSNVTVKGPTDGKGAQFRVMGGK